jgi:hypothetical protein
MPKLPSLIKNLPALISIVLFLVVVAVAGYLFYNNTVNNPDEKQAQETLKAVGIRSTFSGEVTNLYPTERKLDVKNNDDGSIYEVVLDDKGKLTADSKDIEFSEIKVGDKVNVYSKQSNNPDISKVYVADLITKSVPIDPNTIAPQQ